MLSIQQFSYQLPKNLIANKPASPRDHSRLLFIDRQTEKLSHRHFFDLPNLINPSQTVLVLNQTKVFPARLFGQKTSGGKTEILLLRALTEDTWEVMSKPRLKNGQEISFNHDLKAKVNSENQNNGYSHLQFNFKNDALKSKFNQVGFTPLPPYIKNDQDETKLRKQYQTVYAKEAGSSAAPTAGLHFTQNLLKKLADLGTQIEYLTLHVGPGTFQYLHPENIKTKSLHSEEYEISLKTAANLNKAKKKAKKIIAVGTTTTRALESSINSDNLLVATKSNTNIFIYPPYKFKFVDGLITNFHLPETSLLMLISAFTTEPNCPSKFTSFSDSFIGKTYQEAIQNNYRFYSFGDAMLIL